MRNVINNWIRRKYDIDPCCKLRECAWWRAEEAFKRFLRRIKIVRSLLDEEAYEVSHRVRRDLESLFKDLAVEARRKDEHIAQLTAYCIRQDAEIERLKLSGRKWSGSRN
jgi:hypothetical protein